MRLIPSPPSASSAPTPPLRSSKLLMVPLLFAAPAASGFSFSASSFTPSFAATATAPQFGRPKRAGGMTMYESSADPPSSSSPSNSFPSFNAWAVLAKTERWISDTLASTNAAATGGQSQQPQPPKTGPSPQTPSNPYTRKEVEYACEPSRDGALVTANVFRRVREAREQGERHGRAQEELQRERGPSHDAKTFRKTQVVVIPGNPALLHNFSVFDHWMDAINRARRNARDYVAAASSSSPDPLQDWSVSVSCAHLHPKFGELTPLQRLQQLQQEDQVGEIDLNYREYQERKMLARRSPYPTLVLEVRAVPAPDFGAASPPPPTTTAAAIAAAVDSDVTRDDVRRLEALFGKSAALKEEEEDDDDFYNAIGNSLKEVSSVPPLQLAQEWMVRNDPGLAGAASAAFTESDSPHVDAAYEFLFTNLAMMRESGNKRQYLVMPRLLPHSATSFERLAGEASQLLKAVPGFEGDGEEPAVRVHAFHPEHVEPSRRSPVPVYLLEWAGRHPKDTKGGTNEKA